MCNGHPHLNSTITLEKFLVGTSLMYICDPNHFAGHLDFLLYTCDHSNEVNKWISEYCYCREFGTDTNTEFGADSSDCRVSTNLNETIPKVNNFCGPPPTVKNAELNLSASTFSVGQEIIYSFQCGHGQNRTKGILKCQHSGESAAWIKERSGCINKSNGSHEAEGTNYTAHTYALCVSVSVIIVFMVIFSTYKAVQWRMKSTGKCKMLRKNTAPAHNEEEVNDAHVPLNEQ
ncbi:hypothetical protein GDO81_009999 [Engystomops pustulosus]|uniref:Sushi domain-containing protein n=1 Tax=Engystomops pustulosus TaxID=76066 RepID=A0AAV7BXD8_ENGPU|nr:hypothetical protein GDO81_009999 [Engystomops pustulosus]